LGEEAAQPFLDGSRVRGVKCNIEDDTASPRLDVLNSTGVEEDHVCQILPESLLEVSLIAHAGIVPVILKINEAKDSRDFLRSDRRQGYDAVGNRMLFRGKQAL